MDGERHRRAAAGGTRQRMVDSAVALLRERGTAGVTIDAVLARSGAPRGSVYHHFPGGRDELVRAAGRQARDELAAMIDHATSDGDLVAAVTRCARFFQRALVDSDFQTGCPIVALTVDGRPDNARSAALTREFFTAWQDRLRALATARGIPDGRSHRLAALTVAALEGAFILCRAERDTAALDAVVAELALVLAAPAA